MILEHAKELNIHVKKLKKPQKNFYALKKNTGYAILNKNSS